MKFVSVLCSLLVVGASASHKKHRLGTRIFGNDAKPLFGAAAECTCNKRLNCWLVGDPHVKSFFDVYDQVGPDKNTGILDIYTHEDFVINATTFGRDWMDHIMFGPEKAWHKSECNGKAGWLDPLTHEYSDGSSITAQVYCRKRKGNIHINVLLTKSFPVDENGFGLEDYELFSGSTGVCTIQKKRN
jgi:hypothetical protein